MTYRTASRKTRTRKNASRPTTSTRRFKKASSRNAKARAPKIGKLFAVPVNGRRGTVPSAWYFGR